MQNPVSVHYKDMMNDENCCSSLIVIHLFVSVFMVGLLFHELW